MSITTMMPVHMPASKISPTSSHEVNDNMLIINTDVKSNHLLLMFRMFSIANNFYRS